MRRCYARISTAVNPLRRETPKSPWSRRIGFSAPSGHFRIVPFLIGFFAWFLGLLIDGRFFFVLCSASVSYGFVLRLLGGFSFPSVFSYPLRSDGSLVAFVFRSSLLRSCSVFRWGLLRSVVFVFRPYRSAYAFRFPGPRVHFFGCLRFSSSVFPLGGFMSFVRPQVSFIDLSASFSWLCLSSSFPVLHSFSLFRFSLRLRFPLPVLFLRVACVFLFVSWISIAVRPFRLRSPIPPLRITSS